VLRKELGDLLGRVGRKPLTRTLGVVGLFGLLVPLRFTAVANLPVFFAVFMAFLPARLVAIDSLAGERERGTLESLLASPLSDAGIAVGKVAAATLYGALRGWLFVAVWIPGALAARALGLSTAPLPSVGVVAAALAGAVVVAYAAAVFGVWQSARAPSVRAIVESGGALRLAVIVTVFFVGPWLLGLLSPTGEAPQLPVPGSGDSFALDGVWDLAAVSPATTALLAVLAALLGALVLWRLTSSTVRRCRRESLALV
jgi:ABC-type Na+ efflux pump permease subunit